MKNICVWLLALLLFSSSTPIYIVGQSQNPANEDYVATLWITDTSGSFQNAVFLDPNYASQVNNIIVQENSLYSVGQDHDTTTGNDVATLWITDTSGSLQNTVFLDPNNTSQAFAIAAAENSLYIVGYDYDTTTGNNVATLWITDRSGSLQNTVFLDPNNLSHSYAIVIQDNSLYIGGQDYDPTSGNNLATLWITDKSGSLQNKVFLDPNNTSYVNATALQGNTLYIGGFDEDPTIGHNVATLWITDVSGSLQKRVFLDQYHVSSALAIAVEGNALYIGGQDDDSTTGIFEAGILWVTDTSGYVENTVFLSPNNSSVAKAIAVRGNAIYIGGGNYNPLNGNPVAAILWIADRSGSIYNTVLLSPNQRALIYGLCMGPNPVSDLQNALRLYCRLKMLRGVQ